MKTAEFNDLCNREHERDRSVVVKLYLTGESYTELLTEILAGPDVVWLNGAPPDGLAGARLDAMTNPATSTPVKVARTAPFVSGMAEVRGPDGQVRAVEFA